MEKDINFKYEPLSESELKNAWDKHKKIIESFISVNNYDISSIYINERIIMSVIAKVHQRRKYFEYFHKLNMSEFKEVALICFWYIKLKPICPVSKDLIDKDNDYLDFINEKLAVYYIITTLRCLLNSQGKSTQIIDNLSKNYIAELVYSFTYRDISKESLILIVETMAIFLGMQPYSNKDID